MKKNYTIIGLAGAVLLVAGFVYFSFGGVPRGIQKVISNDGLAELAIPKNALPKGVSIKDISITNVSVDDDIIAYEFKPDGTAFSAGLTFKAIFKNRDSIIPVPLLISKANDIEFVSGAETTLDLTKNEATISVPVAHFSGVAIGRTPAYAFFKATIEVPAQVPIGDIVTAKVTLTKTTDSVVLFNNRVFNPLLSPLENNPTVPTLGRTGHRLVRDSVKIKGRASASSIFVPQKDFYDRPPLTPFTGETLTVESSDYYCDTLGFGLIQFGFHLTYEGEAVNIISDGPSGQNSRVESSLGARKDGSAAVFIGTELECVARPSVQGGTGAGVTESESKAIGDIFDEVPSTNTPAASPSATKSPGAIKVCGLPGGPPCPKR